MRRLILALCLLVSPAFADDLPQVPDNNLTPGAIATTDTNVFCHSGYSKTVRHTSGRLKHEIYQEYGIDKKSVRAEVDHRVPLEIGGADIKENLWIQIYDTHPYNATLKDHLENRAREMVCSGQITAEQGQAWFLGDWRLAYDQQFGKPQ